ncbi:MAG: glycosyltransferase family 4 protein [Deltaproteobacteria bacterium]|nr:glycosyltransferase family 4 protein [Candidatus Tharpella sp.]
MKNMKIAVVGNYLPRQCGIATFTTDLCNALALGLKKSGEGLTVVAMDDIDKGYPYADRVGFQVRANVQSDYLHAAEFLNVHKFDAAILQHEFGIFGGEDGSHIFRLIKNLHMPVIATLHTVLKNPTDGQRAVTQKLAQYTDTLVVMAHKARALLIDSYGIEESKITFIPHGIPDVPFTKSTSGSFRTQLGLKGRKIILTFGLLSPGKGVEVMLKAMPAIIEQHPDVSYIILGKTHPHVIKDTGDAYRQSLYQLVRRLGIDDHVLFHNRFVELETLTQYLTAADLYVSPYLKEEQISSGTLAYAMGMGTTVVSTPYWHAQELLAEGRGCLVPFNDPEVLAKKIIHLLAHEKERNEIRKKGYQFSRSAVWKAVGTNYLNLVAGILERTIDQPILQYAKIPDAGILEPDTRILGVMPEINLQHMLIMTDSTGILQHAKYSIPDRTHGYCVDDNARALIVAAMYYALRQDNDVIPQIQTYLSFLHDSFNPEKGRFRNFMSYDRRWLEESGSEDSHGRSLWGLGVAIQHAPYDSIRNMAVRLFLDGLPVVKSFKSPRSWAFVIIALHAYMEVFGGDATARRLRAQLAKKLFALFQKGSSPDWLWCEDKLTYANAKLPHALILAGQWIPNPEMFKMGIDSLAWLLEKQQAPEGHLSVVGNLNWHNKNGLSSNFDQQPIEVMCLIDACAEAFRSTGEMKWIDQGHRCLGWFLGSNDLNEQIYDFKTGGCCDGLQPTGINANQGAESTLSWLISLLSMYEMLGHMVKK